MCKPCNLIEFRDDELMYSFILDLSDIGLETEDEFKYGKLVSYIGRSNTGKEVEFCSYIKEDILQNLVNARSFLLR